jgi:hypothetical protein
MIDDVLPRLIQIEHNARIWMRPMGKRRCGATAGTDVLTVMFMETFSRGNGNV